MKTGVSVGTPVFTSEIPMTQEEKTQPRDEFSFIELEKILNGILDGTVSYSHEILDGYSGIRVISEGV